MGGLEENDAKEKHKDELFTRLLRAIGFGAILCMFAIFFMYSFFGQGPETPDTTEQLTGLAKAPQMAMVQNMGSAGSDPVNPPVEVETAGGGGGGGKGEGIAVKEPPEKGVTINKVFDALDKTTAATKRKKIKKSADWKMTQKDATELMLTKADWQAMMAMEKEQAKDHGRNFKADAKVKGAKKDGKWYFKGMKPKEDNDACYYNTTTRAADFWTPLEGDWQMEAKALPIYYAYDCWSVKFRPGVFQSRYNCKGGALEDGHRLHYKPKGCMLHPVNEYDLLAFLK
eukprot:gene7941-9434_t